MTTVRRPRGVARLSQHPHRHHDIHDHAPRRHGGQHRGACSGGFRLHLLLHHHRHRPTCRCPAQASSSLGGLELAGDCLGEGRHRGGHIFRGSVDRRRPCSPRWLRLRAVHMRALALDFGHDTCCWTRVHTEDCIDSERPSSTPTSRCLFISSSQPSGGYNLHLVFSIASKQSPADCAMHFLCHRIVLVLWQIKD